MLKEQRINLVQDRTVTAIIVAAGQGRRMGEEAPKQYRKLGGKPVLDWSLDAFSQFPNTREVILAAPDADVETLRQTYTPRYPNLSIVAGGETRQDSVSSALAACGPESSDFVFIHDAARPGLTLSILNDLLDALEDYQGAAPALPAADALKRLSADHLESVDRADLFRIQTPQAFRLGDYRRAFEQAPSGVVDDFEIAQAAGLSLTLTRGIDSLMKLTYPEDFETLSRLLDGPTMIPRTGTGFDVHAFEPGDHIVLCGQIIPHTQGLKGHSDADVGWHALTDAILGALCLGDIGDHFPPSDPQWANVPSEKFLRHAADLADKHNAVISHVDVTLICEAPKIKPHRDAMRGLTAKCIGIDVSRVSIKATTTEELGFTGRREGIAAQAVVTLLMPGDG